MTASHASTMKPRHRRSQLKRDLLNAVALLFSALLAIFGWLSAAGSAAPLDYVEAVLWTATFALLAHSTVSDILGRIR